MGWVGQNKLEVVINSPTLGQILSSNLLKTVGAGWVGQNRFRFVVTGPPWDGSWAMACSGLSVRAVPVGTGSMLVSPALE